MLGRAVWITGSGRVQAQEAGFVKPANNDGLIEVVGFKSGFHAGAVMSGAAHGVRLAQARGVHVHVRGSDEQRRTRKNGMSRAYLQLDGEPWKQDVPDYNTGDEMVVRLLPPSLPLAPCYIVCVSNEPLSWFGIPLDSGLSTWHSMRRLCLPPTRALRVPMVTFPGPLACPHQHPLHAPLTLTRSAPSRPYVCDPGSDSCRCSQCRLSRVHSCLTDQFDAVRGYSMRSVPQQ